MLSLKPGGDYFHKQSETISMYKLLKLHGILSNLTELHMSLFTVVGRDI